MKRKDVAREYFLSGKNCSVSVVLAFCDLMGIDEETASKLSIGFGGGFARQRLTCGAVSAMAMVLGALKSDGKDRKTIYELIQKACEEFKKRAGSLVCGELLSGAAASDTSAAPEARTEAYYKKRPCAELVELAAEILENILAE